MPRLRDTLALDILFIICNIVKCLGMISHFLLTAAAAAACKSLLRHLAKLGLLVPETKALRRRIIRYFRTFVIQSLRNNNF